MFTPQRKQSTRQGTLVELATWLTEALAGEVTTWDKHYFYPYCGCARKDAQGTPKGHDIDCPLTRYRKAVLEVL